MPTSGSREEPGARSAGGFWKLEKAPGKDGLAPGASRGSTALQPLDLSLGRPVRACALQDRRIINGRCFKHRIW